MPDLIALGKSIGGGLPLAAFGGSSECMDAVVTGRVLHVGTYNGNPLCMAAARTVLGGHLHPSETARVSNETHDSPPTARPHSSCAECPRTSHGSARRGV